MHESYSDITERIADAPLWFDEHAVPRYCPFDPSHAASVYAVEVLLVEIACQGCDRLFSVAFSFNEYDIGRAQDGTPWMRMRERLTPERVKELHYGDPPNVGCCAAGATMNSIPLRVLEAWARFDKAHTKPAEGGHRVCLAEYFNWNRVPELEIGILPAWAVDEP
jgi:hypothetical protein